MNGLSNTLALIFDLDGVIIDSNPVHEEAWVLYTRRFGITLDAEALGRMCGRRNDDIVRDYFGDHLSAEEILAHGAAKEALFREMMHDQIEQRLVPGVRSFLERHKGMAIGLATNAEPLNVRFVLERAGMSEYFQVVVDGHQVERPKPDPGIYLLAARLLGAAPANCIVFEDSQSGVEAARAAGTRVVGVTTTHSSLDGASLNIENFLTGELEPWLCGQVIVS